MSALLHLDSLDAEIETRLLGSPEPERRLLGIEIERLVLHADSRESAPLDFCRQLMRDLAREFDAEETWQGGVLTKLRGRDFGLSMEPGGQLEVDTDPGPNLRALEEIFLRVTADIEARLASTPYRLFALGHAPVTPVDQLGLLPRERYRIMDRAMIERGSLTRHMMRATAGVQLTCDFADRTAAGRLLALLNRLTPVLVSLTANSRSIGGRDSGYESYRHRVWWDTDVSRTGVPEGCLDAATAVAGYVRFARRAIALFRHGPDDLLPTPAVPFEELVRAGGVTEADLDLHLSSLFPFVRLRRYLEVRCFDTAEWPLAKSALAMLSGVVYCPKATAAAEELSGVLALRDPTALRALHLEAARLGLDAQVPGGPSFRGIAGQLIEFASGTLGGPDCCWATVGDLDPLRARLDS